MSNDAGAKHVWITPMGLWDVPSQPLMEREPLSPGPSIASRAFEFCGDEAFHFLLHF
jgi:hypothetical protein